MVAVNSLGETAEARECVNHNGRIVPRLCKQSGAEESESAFRVSARGIQVVRTAHHRRGLPFGTLQFFREQRDDLGGQ